MNGLIPKGKLTAYQRWELAAFDEAEQAAARAAEAAAEAAAHQAAADAAPETVDEPALALPTAEQIERMHDEARAEGYATGYEEGKAQGHAEGYAAGHDEGQRAAQASAMQIDAVMRNLQESIKELDQQVADRLLATAVEIASQMVHQSLRVKPELLLPVVREAVATLSAHAGHPALFAHPDDAALIREHLGEQLAHNNWRIIDDAQLMPGGCRAELGASEVDATFETRWRRVLEAIGIDTEWLAETQRSMGAHE